MLIAAGYRVKAISDHHWVTIIALPEVMGKGQKGRADYFNACRAKRNVTDYDRVGEISKAEYSATILLQGKIQSRKRQRDALAKIADVLGHKTLQMLKRYVHLSEAHTANVVADMNQKKFG